MQLVLSNHVPRQSTLDQLTPSPELRWADSLPRHPDLDPISPDWATGIVMYDEDEDDVDEEEVFGDDDEFADDDVYEDDDEDFLEDDEETLDDEGVDDDEEDEDDDEF